MKYAAFNVILYEVQSRRTCGLERALVYLIVTNDFLFRDFNFGRNKLKFQPTGTFLQFDPKRISLTKFIGGSFEKKNESML